VGRALLAEEIQQLIHEPGHAGEVHAVAAVDRWTGGVVGPKELVGRVDEMNPHRGRRLEAQV